jgi:hypothetical protein
VGAAISAQHDTEKKVPRSSRSGGRESNTTDETSATNAASTDQVPPRLTVRLDSWRLEAGVTDSQPV